MNEQDLILKQKIEKREKFDTILAYVLLAILVVCIGIILYLKFIKNDEVVDGPEEYVPNYISMSEISSSLNSSALANTYMENGVSFGSSISGNSLVVTYVKDEVNLNLDIPMVGNELMITIKEENSDVITDIYKEIANIICMYYRNEERYCRNTLDNMGNDGVQGIRFVNTEDINTVYITTSESYAINSEIVYNDVTKVYLEENDYTLNISDVSVNNISVVTTDTNVLFAGNVLRNNDDTSDFSVNIKLYDILGNVLSENKYEFNKENILDGTGTFEVEFLLDDSLQKQTIDKYSIEIIK